jgi:hypothetical protein
MLAADRNGSAKAKLATATTEVGSRQERFLLKAKRQRSENREGEQFGGSDSGAVPEVIRREQREGAVRGALPADCDHEPRYKSEQDVPIAQSDGSVLNPRRRI